MSPDHGDTLVTLRRPVTKPAAPSPDCGLVYMETYGCQMNVADSAMVETMLAEAGFRTSKTPDLADVIVINTCAVREKAEDRVFARARELAVHRKRRPGVRLGIIGCMAEHLKADIGKRAPHVNFVVGPDAYRRLATLVKDARDRHGDLDPLIDVRLDKRETYDGITATTSGDSVSGFVTIQRGCDKCCSFCIVPFVRGRERGVPPREVLRQVRAYADAGYREVVLLGQTVNSYRFEDVTFAQLLTAAAKVPGIERVRFTSPYPVDFTEDVIDVIASNDKVCKHVHLPLQSGSDRMLEVMRRGYSVTNFVEIVHRLRRACPDIAITTDILTGFCTETQDDHQDTLKLMSEIRFDSAFMFMYSERSGTLAARKMPDDIPLAEKKRRLAEIIGLQEHVSREVFAAQVGHSQRVLIHSNSKRNAEQVVGRTDGFKSVILPSSAGGPGDFATARIERATMATLFGSPVQERA